MIFGPLNSEQRCLSKEDYAYLSKTADDPKYIPKPVNHLRKEPWLVLRRPVAPKAAKLDPNEGMRELARQKYGAHV